MEFSEVRAKEIIAARQSERGPMLEILHDLQEEFGYIDDEVVPLVAEALNVTRAEVHGVVTFYHDLRRAPAGRHHVLICRAEACQSMGAERLVAEVQDALGLELGQTSPDGELTLEQVFCLGNCALSPAVSVNGRMLGRVDLDRLAVAIGRGAQ